jgi:hypothetical protein
MRQHERDTLPFGHGPNLPIDVDGAAAALQKAGYTVHRLPEKYRKYLQLPLDDRRHAAGAPWGHRNAPAPCRGGSILG